jgi:hypothetical protein
VHYQSIHQIDPDMAQRSKVVDGLQEAVVQGDPMIAAGRWLASSTMTVDAYKVERCSGADAGDSLSFTAFGDHGKQTIFTHVRFHKHEADKLVFHLLVELSARAADETSGVLIEAPGGTFALTSLAETSRPPAATSDDLH